MLIDSHCHLDRLDLTPFGGSLDTALDTARAEGVEHFLCVAISLDRWSAMLDQVADRDDVSVSVGVHPGERDGPLPTVTDLTERAAHPKVVAIGETGLDYYYGGDDKDRQQAAFVTHIEAARDCGKPLIIHTRDARDDTLRLLEQHGADKIGGVLHCFTESWEMAEQAMALGFYISLSGIVTFRNAESLRDVARRMPANRLLVETDSPYLAPVPHRGKSNHPAWVRHVAETVAEVRGETLEQLAATTTANYRRLFDR